MDTGDRGRARQTEYLPIVIVDDQAGTAGYAEDLEMWTDADDGDWPGRNYWIFDSLESALEVLNWREPFVLLLDHNMGDDVTTQNFPDLARALGLDLGAGQIFGYHLCSAIRKQHDLGLILPVTYLSQYCNPEDFVELLRGESPFLPDFLEFGGQGQKATLVEPAIYRMDEHFQAKVRAFEVAVGLRRVSRSDVVDDWDDDWDDE